MFGMPTGTTNITTSTQVSPQGKAARLFNYHIFASATSQVKIFNGGTNGTLFFQEQLDSNRGKTVDLGAYGSLFTNGFFVQTDSGTAFVTVSYRQDIA